MAGAFTGTKLSTKVFPRAAFVEVESRKSRNGPFILRTHSGRGGHASAGGEGVEGGERRVEGEGE
jgi:hypothetical protein